MQGLSCRTAFDGNSAITEVFNKPRSDFIGCNFLSDINAVIKTF